MNFSQTTRGIVRMIALAMAVAVPLAITIEAADARVGGGGSSGSRGSRTYSAPPSTTTAPGAAQPMNRTFTQPGSPGAAGPAAAGAAAKGGFFNRPGMMGGMLGGLAMGFLGAGLFGMLTGGGLFSGLGGLSSIIGLLLQIALIVIVVRLAMSWWQRRNANQTASAYAGPANGPDVGPGQNAQTYARTGTGFGIGASLCCRRFGSVASAAIISPLSFSACSISGRIRAASGRFFQYFFGISDCIALVFSRAGLKIEA